MGAARARAVGKPLQLLARLATPRAVLVLAMVVCSLVGLATMHRHTARVAAAHSLAAQHRKEGGRGRGAAGGGKAEARPARGGRGGVKARKGPQLVQEIKAANERRLKREIELKLAKEAAHRREMDNKAKQNLECRRMGQKEFVTQGGSVTMGIELPVAYSTWIFKFNRDVRYAHMAMVEKCRGFTFAAFQVAPGVKVNGQPRMAVEGLPRQEIHYAYSTNAGISWSKPYALPTGGAGPVWSPVAHSDDAGRLLVFYSAGSKCMHTGNPGTYEPGGDIQYVVAGTGDKASTVSDLTGRLWTNPETILRHLATSDHMARVIANKLTVTANGDWILPFWKEHSRRATATANPKVPCPTRVAGGPNDLSEGTTAGVLISEDKGRTWTPHGSLSDPRTPLLEGALVQLDSGTLKMFFRTKTNCIFETRSKDGGRTWLPARPTYMPNPNSKFDVAKMVYPSKFSSYGKQAQPILPELVMVFNNHRKTSEASQCSGCRFLLEVAASNNGGESWYPIAAVETENNPGVRIHYPSIQQFGTKIMVAYSKFYLDAEMGINSPHQGIRFAIIDLAPLSDMVLPHHKLLDLNAMEALVDRWLREARVESLKKLCCSLGKWPLIVKRLMSIYDLEREGASYLLKQHDLPRYALDAVQKKLYGTTFSSSRGGGGGRAVAVAARA